MQPICKLQTSGLVHVTSAAQCSALTEYFGELAHWLIMEKAASVLQVCKCHTYAQAVFVVWASLPAFSKALALGSWALVTSGPGRDHFLQMKSRRLARAWERSWSAEFIAIWADPASVARKPPMTIKNPLWAQDNPSLSEASGKRQRHKRENKLIFSFYIFGLQNHRGEVRVPWIPIGSLRKQAQKKKEPV